MYITHAYWKFDGTCQRLPNLEGDASVSKAFSRLKRRLTFLGQEGVSLLLQAWAALDKADIPWVVSCRHGDSERMLRLFSSLSQGEVLSPTDFSMSVHNAIIGMFSIATKTKEKHSAISGGEYSFEMGLLEAMATAEEANKPVGYFYYDMSLPNAYSSEVDNNFQSRWVILIIDKNKKGIDVKIGYDITQKKEIKIISIDDFIGYLNSNDRDYEILVPGGRISFERSSG